MSDPQIAWPDPRDPTRGSSEPDRCWTMVNMSEATPDVMTPMCWSLWTLCSEVGSRRAWHELELLPRTMLAAGTDPNHHGMSTFYGRQALNVDRVAAMMGSLPGTSREAVERSFLGTVRETAPRDRPPRRRIAHVLAKATVAFAIHSRRSRRLYADQLAWWRRDVLAGLEKDGAALLTSARRRFAHAIHLHSHSRFQGQAIHSAVERMTESVDMTAEFAAVLGGFGGIVETVLAEDLWRWSRNEIREDQFIARHGYHGSCEGNVSGRPWRLDRRPIRAAVAALAQRPGSESPWRRTATAKERHNQAVGRLRAALPPSKRPLLAMLLVAAGRRIRAQERTKAAFLMAIDGARAALSLIGPELVGAGVIDTPAEAVFLTVEEHLAALPPDARELVAFRRERREHYRTLRLPTTFTGMPVPIAVEAEADLAADVVVGAAGSAGVAEGAARVLHTLDDVGEVGPGEILVCPYTDPAWVVAMSLAEGLVIDIGAPGSHGAVVARELGIPCVIGTGVGTSTIRTGDRIRVDGAAGEVRILRRGAQTTVL